MSLVTATPFERAADQLDFVSFDLPVEVDAVAIKELFGARRVIRIEFGLESFNLGGQCVCENEQLRETAIEFRFRLAVCGLAIRVC